MKNRSLLPIIVLLGLCGSAHAELIIHENRGELGPMMLYDPNFGDLINGQSLNITSDALSQPAIGETPEGSVFFMHILDRAGDFIWMGTGQLTNTVRSTEGTPIIDPDTQQDVDYYGPQDFELGAVVDETANFVEGWRAIHGFNRFTGTPGVFTVSEQFTVGIEFQLADGTHYGFAEFDRVFEVRNGFVNVDITPVRWGYESVAGVGAGVVPAPATLGLLLFGGFAASTTRRR